MRVVSLTTLGFRNLVPAEVELGEGVTLLHGANGSGKTNLLEALYMGLAGRSCRTRADRETIAFGEPLSRAEVVIEDAGERREFLCAVDRESGRRHLVNGSPMPDSAQLRPPVAVFMPDRLTLVKGPPAARRSHLDGFVSALRPARAEARRRYARALAQRNALVSRIRAGSAAPDSLDAWDSELAEAGVELMDDPPSRSRDARAALRRGRGRAGAGRPRASLRAQEQGRRRRGAARGALREARVGPGPRILRPRTRTSTRWRSRFAGGRHGGTPPRASSAPCSSPFSSRSATRFSPSAPSLP